MSKYRVTTNGEDFRVEEQNPITGFWRNRFARHFATKEDAKAKVAELEAYDAEKRHEWTVVE